MSASMIAFTKMQGAGNDYIYIDASRFPVAEPEKLAQRLSNRHFSIGADGLVLIMPSSVANIRMRMFNADGSEAQMCGNAARCVARYAREHGLVLTDNFTLETLAGIKHISICREHSAISSVIVDMGEPLLPEWDAVPSLPLAQYDSIALLARDFTIVDMGNPHAVCFVEDVNSFPVCELGAQVEMHPVFPLRTNVEFVQVIDDEHLLMRVWERGTGETLACGTGACASLVAAVWREKAKRKAELQLLGGNLQVEWNEQNNHIFLQGPAEYAFEGTIQL